MIAFVRDCELHVLYALCNEERRLTSGAAENGMVSFTDHYMLLEIFILCFLAIYALILTPVFMFFRLMGLQSI